MNIRILGAGMYGCHIASALIDDGHSVEVWELRDHIFGGASGNIPARLHQGFHYPRSKQTRDACRAHTADFMAAYGKFSRMIPVNLYAIAENHSLVDYAQYVSALADEVPFIEVNPAEYGLAHCEGALLTQERHIVTDDLRIHFEQVLDGHILYKKSIDVVDSPDYDLTIDCTFCAHESAGIDRYEPCIVALLRGRTDKAVTIMDGPFVSLYPWNEDLGLCSLSGAKWTPYAKDCKSWDEAKQILDDLTLEDHVARMHAMFADMRHYYPAMDEYELTAPRLSIRAMPLSGADSRLVDVVEVGEKAVRVRAGKIDAVVHAEHIIKERYIR